MDKINGKQHKWLLNKLNIIVILIVKLQSQCVYEIEIVIEVGGCY